MIRWIYAQTIELFALLMVVVLCCAQLVSRRQMKPIGGKGRPILLVHGYLNAGAVWIFHRRFLAKRGLGPIYTIDLGSPLHSIRSYAQRVHEKAQEIARETGRADLTLIGHSMGGLVSYYYALKLAARGSVHQVITIASPLQGTHAAKIGLGRCAREMEIGSDLIQEIGRAVEGRRDTTFYNIATRTDELVIPYSSSFLHSTPDHQRLFDDLGHASLLFSKRVSEQMFGNISKSIGVY